MAKPPTDRPATGPLGPFEPKSQALARRLPPSDQIAQAEAMMRERLFGGSGATISAIAEKYQVDPATVKRRLALARKAELPAAAREVFIQDMLPLAMAVAIEAMRGEDPKLRASVAMTIISGLKAMEPPSAAGVPDAEAGSPSGDTESFEFWRAKVVRAASRTTQPATVQATDAPSTGSVIQGVLVPAAPEEPLQHAAQYPPSTRPERRTDSMDTWPEGPDGYSGPAGRGDQ